MQQQPRGPGDNLTPRDGANLLFQLCLSFSTCVTVFLRSGFGIEYFGGWTGPGAFVLLILVAGSDKSGLMAPYFWAWLFALAFQRMVSVGNRRKGIVEHSRYGGFPKIAMLIPGVKRESVAKGIVEPALCLVVGMALHRYFEVAGMFFILEAAALAIVEGTLRRIEAVKLQQMRDGNIEAQRMAGLFRGEILD